MQKFVKASLMQFSSVVGAGVLTLPYVLYNSNFIFSWAGVMIIALAIILVNKFYLDIIFEKKSIHQLPGYVNKYLGKGGGVLAFLAMNLSFFGAMLVYIKLGSSLFQNIFHMSDLGAMVMYLVLIVGGYLFLNNNFKTLLSFLPLIIIFLFWVIFTFGMATGRDVDVGTAANFNFIGPVVFALTGFLIIPDIAAVFDFDSKRRTSAILASIVGVILALFIYYFFTFGVITLSDGLVAENGIDGLTDGLKIIVSTIGILTTFRSSQNFLNIFSEVFKNDLKLDSKLSFYLPLVMPLLSLLFIKVSFLTIMSWVGVGSMSVLALLICMTRMKIRPNFWIMLSEFFILTIFILGIWSLL